MSARTPFGLFLAHGRKGQTFAALSMRDANAVSAAFRAGRSVTTERAVIVRGPADKPEAAPVTIVTLQDDPR